MSIPTSALFDVFDWGPNTLTSATNGVRRALSAQDTLSGFTSDTYLVANADCRSGSVDQTKQSALTLHTSVGDSFTFEVDVLLPDALPDGFASTSRLFVGAVSGNGSTAGLFFSKEGIGYGTGPDDQIIAILGTAGLLVDEFGNRVSWLTVRLTVTAGVMSIFITSSPYADNDDYGVHRLIYSTAAPASTGGSDRIVVYASASQGTDCSVAIRSLRLSSSFVPSIERPTAKISALKAYTAGQHAALSGLNSTVPYTNSSTSLTYKWNVVTFSRELPEFTDGIQSSGNLSEFTVRAKKKGNYYDGRIVHIRKNPVSGGPTLIVPTELGIEILLAQLGGTITAYVSDVVAIFNTATLDGHSDEVGVLYEASYSTDELAQEGTFALSGGVGSTAASPLLDIAHPGPYRIELVVNDGITDSLPESVEIIALPDTQLLGNRPGMGFLFGALSDFWGRANGTRTIESAWTGIAQVAANTLLAAWQNDFAKSIHTIPAKYQRRWVTLPVKLDVPEPLATDSGGINYFTLVTPSNTGSWKVEPTGSYQYALQGNQLATTSKIPTGRCIVVSESGATRVCDIARSSSARAILSYDAVDTYEMVSSGTRAYVMQHPETGALSSNFLGVRAGRLRTNNVKVGDIVKFNGNSRTITAIRPVVTIGGDPVALANTIEFSGDPIEYDHYGMYEYEIVRQVPYAFVHRYPYITLHSDIDLAAEEIIAGDQVLMTYVSTEGVETQYRMPILAVDGSDIYPDYRATVDLVGSLELGTLTRISVVRSDVMHFDSTIVDIPTLGFSTISPEYRHNKDFTVDRGVITFLPLVAGTVRVSNTNPRAVVFADTVPTGAKQVRITRGEVGVYRVVSVSGNTAVTDHVFSVLNTDMVGYVPSLGFNSNMGSTLFAEVVYHDNSQMVENRYGKLVGLKKDDLLGTDLDYLAAVKALYYARLHGATPACIKLVTQAFLGLPYVDEDGVIIAYEQNKYVTVRTSTDKIRRFTLTTEIATNPATGLPYKALNELEDYSDADLLAATILAYSPLVDVVTVDDYVTNPTLMARILSGGTIIQRTHTFAVRIPSDFATSEAGIRLALAFLDGLRPANTQMKMVVTADPHSEVDVDDDTAFSVTRSIRDGLYTSPWVHHPDYEYAATFPVDFTARKNGDDFDNIPAEDPEQWDYEDVKRRFAGSYVVGQLDDYNGNGSWNAKHEQVDMVNTLDGDIDVLATTEWVPIHKVSVSGYEADFAIGEEVFLSDDGTTELTGYGWDSDGDHPGTSPIIIHVGSGSHPKLPHVNSPQNEHPRTYLILGFNNEDVDDTNPQGTTSRLYAIGRRSGSETYIVGRDSGAVALLLPVRNAAGQYDFPSLESALVGDTDHTPYFNIHRLFEMDRHLYVGPEINTSITNTVYIPVGGISVGDIGADLIINDLQVQVHPYDPTVPLDEQMVPSTGPGLFNDWDNNTSGSPLSPTDMFTYGYTDAGYLTTGTYHSGAANSSWDMVPSQPDLVNVHIGFKVSTIPGWHKTHGIVQFEIPAPIIDHTVQSSDHVRIEGFYFVDNDPSMTTTPDDSSFDGTEGGSYVFFRNVTTSIEYPASSMIFETGNAAGVGIRYVLGMDGYYQSSTGHVITAYEDASMPDGTYDVVLRQYRPWKQGSLGPDQLHIDTAVAEAAFVKSSTYSGGYGAAEYGTSGYGY